MSTHSSICFLRNRKTNNNIQPNMTCTRSFVSHIYAFNLCDSESFVRGGPTSTKFVFLFGFKLMRGERIQIPL